MGKIAQRVQKTLEEYAVWKEPNQLDPSSILVVPAHRDGAPPNVPHIHGGILKGLLDNGFDSTRPAVGVCVEFKTSESKRKLLEHNRRFSASHSQLPKIDESKVLYGSLASSHLNLALRLIQQGAAGPTGTLLALCEKRQGPRRHGPERSQVVDHLRHAPRGPGGHFALEEPRPEREQRHSRD